jgi:hypothetical protein
VAAAVVAEPADEDVAVIRTATGEDVLPGGMEEPISAPAAVAPGLPQPVAAQEPIPLLPTPRGRFRRLASSASPRDGQGRAPVGESADQVPVSGLFTSILGARVDNGGRTSPNGNRIHRVPEPVQPTSRSNPADGRADSSSVAADAPVEAHVSMPTPTEPGAAEPAPEPAETELVAVRAEGKGD